MRWGAALALVFLLLVAGAAVLLWYFFPVERAVAYIGRAVERATGFELRVAVARFDPFRGLELEGLSLTNPAARKRPTFLRVGRVLLRYELGALWKGRLLVREVRVEEPRLLAEWEAPERWNLTSPLPRAPEEPGAPLELPRFFLPIAVELRSLEVRGIGLSVRHEDEFELVASGLRLEAAGSLGGAGLSVSGRLSTEARPEAGVRYSLLEDFPFSFRARPVVDFTLRGARGRPLFSEASFRVPGFALSFGRRETSLDLSGRSQVEADLTGQRLRILGARFALHPGGAPGGVPGGSVETRGELVGFGRHFQILLQGTRGELDLASLEEALARLSPGLRSRGRLRLDVPAMTVWFRSVAIPEARVSFEGVEGEVPELRFRVAGLRGEARARDFLVEAGVPKRLSIEAPLRFGEASLAGASLGPGELAAGAEGKGDWWDSLSFRVRLGATQIVSSLPPERPRAQLTLLAPVLRAEVEARQAIRLLILKRPEGITIRGSASVEMPEARLQGSGFLLRAEGPAARQTWTLEDTLDAGGELTWGALSGEAGALGARLSGGRGRVALRTTVERLVGLLRGARSPGELLGKLQGKADGRGEALGMTGSFRLGERAPRASVHLPRVSFHFELRHGERTEVTARAEVPEATLRGPGGSVVERGVRLAMQARGEAARGNVERLEASMEARGISFRLTGSLQEFGRGGLRLEPEGRVDLGALVGRARAAGLLEGRPLTLGGEAKMGGLIAGKLLAGGLPEKLRGEGRLEIRAARMGLPAHGLRGEGFRMVADASAEVAGEWKPRALRAEGELTLAGGSHPQAKLRGLRVRFRGGAPEPLRMSAEGSVEVAVEAVEPAGEPAKVLGRPLTARLTAEGRVDLAAASLRASRFEASIPGLLRARGEGQLGLRSRAFRGKVEVGEFLLAPARAFLAPLVDRLAPGSEVGGKVVLRAEGEGRLPAPDELRLIAERPELLALEGTFRGEAKGVKFRWPSRALRAGGVEVKFSGKIGREGMETTLAAETGELGLARNSIESSRVELKVAGSALDRPIEIAVSGRAQGGHFPSLVEGRYGAEFSLRARASLREGRLDVEELAARVPGLVALKGRGEYTHQGKKFKGDTELSSLSLEGAQRALRPLWMRLLPGLSLGGALAGSLRVSGSVPPLDLLASLAEDPTGLEKLPLEADARILLQGVKAAWAQPRASLGGAEGEVQIGHRPGAEKLSASISLRGLRLPGAEASPLRGEVRLEQELRGLSEWRLAEARIFLTPEAGESDPKTPAPSLSGRLSARAALPKKRVAEWRKLTLRELLESLRAEFRVEGGIAARRPFSLGLPFLQEVGGEGGLRAEGSFAPESGFVLAGELRAEGFSLRAGPARVRNLRGRFPFEKRLRYLGEGRAPDGAAPPSPGRAGRGELPEPLPFGEELRAYSAARDNLVAEEVEVRGVALKDLRLDLFFRENALVVEHFSAALLGGSLLGNALTTVRGDAPALQAEVGFSGVDTRRLLPRSSAIPTSQSEVNGEMRVSLSLLSEPGRRGFDLDAVDLRFHLTRVGGEALDQVLLFLDPEETNPAIAGLRRALHVAGASPSRVTAEIAHGNLSLDVEVQARGLAGLVAPAVKLPALRRVNLSAFKNFGPVREALERLEPLKQAFQALNARAFGLGDGSRPFLR